MGSTPTGNNFFAEMFLNLDVNSGLKCKFYLNVKNLIQLKPIELDHMEILDLLVNHASIVQRGEHQIQMSKVLSSMLNAVMFYCCIFFLCPSKICDANIAIIVNFGYFV